MYKVYLITNLINGKFYVGQTKKELASRWQEHLQEASQRSTNRLLYNAIRKYGPENFTIEILQDGLSEMEIDFYECFYIQKFKSYYEAGLGYNMTYGGQGTHGYIFTDETKQKISQGTRQKWSNIKNLEPERYAQICAHRSEIAKGKPKSEAHRKKLSEQASQRTGEKNSFYGKHFTEDSKEKLRAAWDKRVPSVQATQVDTGEITVYRSVSEAVRALNLKQSAISRITLVCKTGKGKAYNHYWTYIRKDGDN